MVAVSKVDPRGNHGVLFVFCLHMLAELAARDPEWFEKIDKITPADMVAVAEEFTKAQVAKVQHGEQQQQQLVDGVDSRGQPDPQPKGVQLLISRTQEVRSWK